MPVVPFGAPPRPPTKTKEVQIAEVRDQAWALGNVLQDVRKWDKMMSNAIASRLSRRVGEDVYQCAAIRMHGVPREALTRWMPPPTTRNEKELSWEFESASEVSTAFSAILENSRYMTAGASRALQLPSEPVFRLVATMTRLLTSLTSYLDRAITGS